ncbi:MAG: DHH family phosphoesterase [Candidatus Bathyarchaeota archaeon]
MLENRETAQFERLLALLNGIDAKTIFLFCHHNADPDALCSAYALSKLLERTVPNAEVTIAAPQGLSKLSKQVLTRISTKIAVSPSIEGADAIILLDTSTLQQLDDWRSRIECCKKPLIVVDHHITHPETETVSTLQIVDEHSSSACEVVFELFKEASIKPRAKEALAIFIGMTYDTKHFSIANSNTFKTAAELIGLGARAEEAFSLLEMPMDSSERIARLKAAGRLQLVRLGEWLLALSSVNSYQASAARGLISLGAHVAVVSGKREGKLRINMRSSREFYLKTKIHLGRDIAETLGIYVKGMGGGHSTSAGVNGEGDVETTLSKCLELFRGKLLKHSFASIS